VKFVLSSGMPAAIWENFERRFAVKVLEAYGAIEGGMAFRPIGRGPVGSFGKPPPTLEIKIVDEDGNEWVVRNCSREGAADQPERVVPTEKSEPGRFRSP